MNKMFLRKMAVSLLAVLLPAVAFGQANSDSTVYLNLDKALEIALASSPVVKVVDKEITKQEYSKKGVLANLFPTVDFSANYNRTIKKQVMYMDAGMSGGMGGNTEAGFEVGRSNTWSAGFSASMPIVSATLWQQLSVSADAVELAVEQSRSSKLSMVSQVKQAYYGVLLANDSYKVFKETYDNAMENYIDVKQKYDQGLVSEYDLIRANVSVKNAEPNMYDAENSIVLAKWRLKALMGVDLDMQIECEGNLMDYVDRLYTDYMSVDTTMIAGNSSLRQLDIQHSQLVKSKKIAQAAYYPSLNLSFSHQWMAMSDNFKFSNYRWNPYTTFGVSLNIPIFSGGSRYSSLKQSQIELEQLELNRLDTERNLMVSVRQYVDQMKTSIKQYQASSEGVSEAQKGYDIALKRYDTGAGTLLEINDSQLALTVSQNNRNQAIYSFLVAKASLDEMLGTDYVAE